MRLAAVEVGTRARAPIDQGERTFYHDNTMMLLADAKKTIEETLEGL